MTVVGQERIKTGIVIGSYNMPDMIRLQIACVRKRCGEVPVMISDDCSPGFGEADVEGTVFGDILDVAIKNQNVLVWPNAGRIGHAGGDMAAFWKAIVWGSSTGLDVVFKLSQRYVIDIDGWDQLSARRLMLSGLATLGKGCRSDGWDIRTEAVGLRVQQWNRRIVLAQLTPRPIFRPTEDLIYENVRDRLDGRFCPWDMMSDARSEKADGILFRATHSPAEYVRLARKLQVTPGVYDSRESTEMADYVKG